MERVNTTFPDGHDRQGDERRARQGGSGDPLCVLEKRPQVP
jgi:hypothetical protein